MRYAFSGLIVGFFFMTGPLVAHAQFLGDLNRIEITLSPQYPQAHQEVTATITAPTTDVRNAYIVWVVNDETILEGSGAVSATFTAAPAGQAQTIRALIKNTDASVQADSITIHPAHVSLLWEGRTYTPPWYKGRGLYTSGSIVTLEAQPFFVSDTGTIIDPASLIYTWKRNNTTLLNNSGIGRSSVSVVGPKFYGDDIISVEVSTTDGSRIANAATLITTSDPLVQLYEYSPLLGIQYHDAVLPGDSFFDRTRSSFVALPYFMDAVTPRTPALSFAWLINGTAITPQQDDPSRITIAFEEEERADITVRVAIEHVQHLLQGAAAQWRISLEGGIEASPFGAQ